MKRAFHASGKVADGEPFREELLLELEAKDHVQPVARLVRVHADESTLVGGSSRDGSSRATRSQGVGNAVWTLG